MNFREYEWDDVNIEHIAQHGVISQEVEEASSNSPLIFRRNDRYLVYGQSDSGRYLFIVVVLKKDKVARVITARDMSKTEHKLYHKKRG